MHYTKQSQDNDSIVLEYALRHCEIPKFEIKGIIKEIRPVNAFNGDYLVFLETKYRTDNTQLRQRGIYEETATMHVLIRNYPNPKILKNKAVFGHLTPPKEGLNNYLVLTIKSFHNVRKEPKNGQIQNSPRHGQTSLFAKGN